MSDSQNLSAIPVDLFKRDDFEAFVLALPGVEIVHQWGDASVGKVGGKIFAIYSIWNKTNVWHVSFKCSDMSFNMLPELSGISPAKYLARAKWVDVSPQSALTMDDIKAYIVQAHRLVASKLTRAKKSELGLDETIFARPKADRL